jgi:transposase
MEPVLREFRDRLRRRLAPMRYRLQKLLAALTPEIREIHTQRMCPFCGLVTSRSKQCLECGKTLAEVHT